MENSRNWNFELSEYIKQGEPDKAQRSESWKAAIGLQDVDGLKTSEYLLDTAKEHIEGKISIETVQKRLNSYYEQQNVRKATEEGTEEADKVAARIAEILSENTFQFSPAEFKAIHRRLFSDVFKHAGEIRTYNITKKEWVLKGDTVLYASFDSINDTLDYDFAMEKAFSYKDLPASEAIKHIAKFTAGIWQIHPFCEGNTRATAVFIIKYLKSFGFNVNNDLFSENSWYFRNALVNDGYYMVQYSVYARLCNGPDGAEKHYERLKKIAPSTGSIRVLSVTEKQYASIKIIAGEKKPPEKSGGKALLERKLWLDQTKVQDMM